MTDLLALLQEFHRDKVAELIRHQSGARLVAPYDFNNAYQYIVNREETQVTWLATAIADLGGTVPPEPVEAERHGSGGRLGWRSIVEEDAVSAQAFVDRWRPRVDAVVNARHRGMLHVVLGETLEQKRFFDQALAGQDDLLGRRGEAVGPRVGEVLPSRWMD